MYLVTIPRGFTKADGKPFQKFKEDKEGKLIRALDDDGKPIPTSRDAQGNTVTQYELGDATYLDMLKAFLNNVFEIVATKARDNKEAKPLMFEDSASAVDVFRAINTVTDDKLELEKAPKEWLERIITTHGTAFFGVNTALMLEPIKKAEEQAPNRAERRREEKKK